MRRWFQDFRQTLTFALKTTRRDEIIFFRKYISLINPFPLLRATRGDRNLISRLLLRMRRMYAARGQFNKTFTSVAIVFRLQNNSYTC